ncbi:MAG: hypothetical protein HQ581_23345, partial [Planctomycetes bacterium]|nr:hypothetical protein [Planctomycetota bacterium]
PVAIHPSVDLDDLRNLKRWDYVLVAQKEMVVIGTWADDPFLWKEAQAPGCGASWCRRCSRRPRKDTAG